MTDNGKDVIDAGLGLRVRAATVKETEDGGATATITIAGQAKGLVKLVGEQVNVRSAGARSHHGLMTQVTVKAGKEGKPRTVTAKVAGAREMESFVGLLVTIEEGEPHLPGIGEAKKRGKDAAAGEDA